MILLKILAIMLLIMIIAAILLVSTGGALCMIMFGDVIVCIGGIVFLIRKVLIKKKK